MVLSRAERSCMVPDWAEGLSVVSNRAEGSYKYLVGQKDCMVPSRAEGSCVVPKRAERSCMVHDMAEGSCMVPDRAEGSCMVPSRENDYVWCIVR